MSRIAIVGGHGQISQLLIPLLVSGGHQPVALVRNSDHFSELEGLGAEVALLDIESSDSDDFAAAFSGSDAVLFAAGGGGDGSVERKRTVDLEGSLKSIEGAQTAGINRFVQISAISVDEAVDPDAGEAWVAYVEAKRGADEALRASGLDWTIVRPGGLTDDGPTGRVTLATSVERGSIPRADVAAVLAEVLDSPDTAGTQWEVVSGDTPIADAVSAISH